MFHEYDMAVLTKFRSISMLSITIVGSLGKFVFILCLLHTCLSLPSWCWGGEIFVQSQRIHTWSGRNIKAIEKARNQISDIQIFQSFCRVTKCKLDEFRLTSLDFPIRRGQKEWSTGYQKYLKTWYKDWFSIWRPSVVRTFIVSNKSSASSLTLNRLKKQTGLPSSSRSIGLVAAFWW